MRKKKKKTTPGKTKERSADKGVERRINTTQNLNEAGRDRSLTTQAVIGQDPNGISPAQPLRRGSARGERSTLIRDTGANVMD